MYTGGLCHKCYNCDCRRQNNNNNFFTVLTNNSNSAIISPCSSGYYSKPSSCSRPRYSVHFNTCGDIMGPTAAASGTRISSRKPILVSSNTNNNNYCGGERKSVQRKPEPFRKYCGRSNIFEAPPIVPQKKPITSAVRDYGPSSVRSYVAVPQGVQLYEDNPQGDIRISREEFDKLVAHAYKEGPSTFVDRSGRKCTELDKPKFNSIRKSVKDIQVAIGDLQRVPIEIQRNVLKDPGKQQKIREAVTKKMNIPPKSRLYQDLISIEAEEAERRRSAEEILKTMKSLHPPPKPKDTEPSILDFNKPTFSRMKPKLPDPPPKPSKGVSANLREDYQLIVNEREFTEKDSNASLFELQLVE